MQEIKKTFKENFDEGFEKLHKELSLNVTESLDEVCQEWMSAPSFELYKEQRIFNKSSLFDVHIAVALERFLEHALYLCCCLQAESCAIPCLMCLPLSLMCTCYFHDVQYVIMNLALIFLKASITHFYKQVQNGIESIVSENGKQKFEQIIDELSTLIRAPNSYEK